MSRPKFGDWFAYFPQDYRWSAAMSLVLGAAPYGGSDLGEADQAGRSLRDRVGDDEAWFETWRELGNRLVERAVTAERCGRRLTASAAYVRACAYLQIGERFRTPKDEVALACYRDSVAAFHRFAELSDGPQVEAVEVPFGSGSLPAYLVHAEGGGNRPPCVVYFDGLDITKEMCFLRGAAELARRGVSSLLVDGPGNGESIRFRGLPLRLDYEVAGGAALDFLEARPDVDASRVGVLAISLGGYYAARCASLEPRFKACVAWGAIWDYQATWAERVAANFSGSLSVPGHHISWVLGVDTVEEALEKLRDFRLEGVVERMRCPFLLLHGEHDEQVPLAVAHRLLAACGSTDKTLRVFTSAEGGAQHCQSDQLTMATTEFSDWLAERL
ncbi:MAG: alpha/beta hydrolase family protein [Candidatus Dormibacter sp.]|uniref:alpha/beta hydrolase family protein n=1 Tax=Candidatus Dormibacter sp. TaxID=2973982 RepID=UPI003D9BBDA1